MTEQASARIAGLKATESVCPYRAVGCGQVVYTRGGELVDIEGNPRSPVNQGTLCPKGSASRQLVQQLGKLTKVRYRRPGGTAWEDLELEQAMDMIAERIVAARESGWQDVDDDPSHVALSRLETGAIVTELALSTANELRLSRSGDINPRGAPRALFRGAEASVVAGLALPLLVRRPDARRLVQNLSSLLYLTGGLVFRLAWVQAGKASALDDETVAATAHTPPIRDGGSTPTGGGERMVSEARPSPASRRLTPRMTRVWSRAIGGASLLMERLVSPVRG